MLDRAHRWDLWDENRRADILNENLPTVIGCSIYKKSLRLSDRLRARTVEISTVVVFVTNYLNERVLPSGQRIDHVRTLLGWSRIFSKFRFCFRRRQILLAPAIFVRARHKETENTFAKCLCERGVRLRAFHQTRITPLAGNNNNSMYARTGSVDDRVTITITVITRVFPGTRVPTGNGTRFWHLHRFWGGRGGRTRTLTR